MARSVRRPAKPLQGDRVNADRARRPHRTGAVAGLAAPPTRPRAAAATASGGQRRWKSVTAEPSERYRRSSPIRSIRPVRRSRSRTELLTWASISSIERSWRSATRSNSMSVVGHVEVGGRGEVDEQAVGRGSCGTQQVADLRPGDVRVEEVQRRVEAEDEEPGDRLRVRVAQEVAEGRAIARDAAEGGDVRPARAVEQEHDRQQDSDDQADQDGRQHHPDRARRARWGSRSAARPSSGASR